MFIVGGSNANPAEIEQLMSTHPSIAQVAVALVAARDGASLGPAEVIAW